MSKKAINISLSKLLCFKIYCLVALVYAAAPFLFAKNAASQNPPLQIWLETPDNKTQILNGEGVKIDQKTFAIYWHSDSSLLYKYRLVPHTQQWSSWSKRNAATFFKVKEGTYRFQLELSNGNKHEATVLIDLPFWKQTMFYIALIVLISFVTFVVIIIAFKQRIRLLTHSIENEVRKTFRIRDKANQRTQGTKTNSVRQTRTRSRKYKKVTVLFADIQGFTKIVEHINPETLVDELDRFFIQFDAVVEKYNIEKIKTIGDAYMCAGGIPNINRTNPIEVVLAGLEMQKFMQDSRAEQKSELGFWELRIGIHTGPVISGEVGTKNVSFDIWGDTVNIASRMESSGMAGMINITGVTYELIKDFFICDYRGKMPVKYKGETDMYFVRRLKPELSADETGALPNRKFRIKLQHIRLGDLETFILNKLNNELSENIQYHNGAHTKDVLTRVEILARGEKVSSEDLLLLKTAALLHDVGFLVEYDNHEDNSIKFTKEILPGFKYEDDQIEQVVELINATRHENKPRNYLERILKDADLDYLGRADFISLSDKLYKELNTYNGKMSIKEWNQQQYEFIGSHTYYTATARELRQVNKTRQLQKLKALVDNK